MDKFAGGRVSTPTLCGRSDVIIIRYRMLAAASLWTYHAYCSAHTISNTGHAGLKKGQNYPKGYVSFLRRVSAPKRQPILKNSLTVNITTLCSITSRKPHSNQTSHCWGRCSSLMAVFEQTSVAYVIICNISLDGAIVMKLRHTVC